MNNRSKSVMVLNLMTADKQRPSVVSFQTESEDPFTPPTHQINMALEDWEDFGHPDTITVTVEAGDALNIPDEIEP